MRLFMESAREVYGRHARLAVGVLIVLGLIWVAVVLGLMAKALVDFGHVAVS